MNTQCLKCWNKTIDCKSNENAFETVKHILFQFKYLKESKHPLQKYTGTDNKLTTFIVSMKVSCILSWNVFQSAELLNKYCTWCYCVIGYPFSWILIGPKIVFTKHYWLMTSIANKERNTSRWCNNMVIRPLYQKKYVQNKLCSNVWHFNVTFTNFMIVSVI